MNTKKQHLRGSALVFSLLVLSMLLAIAVSGATITIATKQSARGTEKSMLALQTADGALEEMFFRVYKNTDTDLDDLAGNVYGPGVGCNGGTISGMLDEGSGSYAVTFFDTNDQKIACGDAAWRTKLVYMVAIGTFAGTTRAISVGITPL